MPDPVLASKDRRWWYTGLAEALASKSGKVASVLGGLLWITAVATCAELSPHGGARLWAPLLSVPIFLFVACALSAKAMRWLCGGPSSARQHFVFQTTYLAASILLPLTVLGLLNLSEHVRASVSASSAPLAQLFPSFRPTTASRSLQQPADSAQVVIAVRTSVWAWFSGLKSIQRSYEAEETRLGMGSILAANRLEGDLSGDVSLVMVRSWRRMVEQRKAKIEAWIDHAPPSFVDEALVPARPQSRPKNATETGPPDVQALERINQNLDKMVNGFDALFAHLRSCHGHWQVQGGKFLFDKPADLAQFRRLMGNLKELTALNRANVRAYESMAQAYLDRLWQDAPDTTPRFELTNYLPKPPNADS